ncbi:DUF5709 domain-containing protein [Aestuariimicrobium soli]|uniref:DUF5709 domain-containing protein n=1 Tax=Aestuariimicrobium soli TaxID=2035834 RepID=UPI003EBBB7D3
MEGSFETDELVPDDSEQLDQLDQADTLIDRGVNDPLDEGWIAPDHWSAGEGFGNTAAEQRQGESLEMRMTQEEPEVVRRHEDWNPDHEPREVGRRRAGRLVAASRGDNGDDVESEEVGEDVGFAGGAASAEEAAMHVFDPDHDSDDEEWDGEEWDEPAAAR